MILGIYKLEVDWNDGPVKVRYSHVANNSNTINFTNSGWEIRVYNNNQYLQTKIHFHHVVLSTTKTKNYFNDEVWRQNNRLVEWKTSRYDNNITLHLIAFWLEFLRFLISECNKVFFSRRHHMINILWTHMTCYES